LLGALAAAHAKGPASGPGHVLIGVDASVWDSGIPFDPPNGIWPIGGGGQINGEFTVAERNGIQIGLRAQERTVGPIMAVPNRNNKVGIYEAASGVGVTGLANWNYDWHVDLQNAQGVARGTDLSDYDLTLDTNISTTLYGAPVPVDLTGGGIIAGNAVLYQNSWNPLFGNVEFNPFVAGTYDFVLTLTPKTFNGPPLQVTIQVNVN
jgi:hypothetical protein